MKKYLLFFSPLLLSCSTHLYVPIENAGNIPVEDLKHGRESYVQHCGSCHQLYLPQNYTAVAWAQNLDEMQPKAKITDTEKQLIYQYLVNAPKQK